MAISKEQRAVIENLTDGNVRFIVIGGYAAIFHGAERMTEDIDLWIDRNQMAAALATLNPLNLAYRNICPSDFIPPAEAVRIAGSTVDLLLRCKGVDFDAAFARAHRGEIDGIPVRFLSRRDLIVNKLCVHRRRDLMDVMLILVGPSGQQPATIL